MLELDNAQATIKQVSLRCEKHGPEDVAAADLKIEMKQPNRVLSFFGSQLLNALYWRDVPAGQALLPDVEAVAEKPNLRCPQLLGPLALDYEGAGYTIRIDHGIDASSAIVIDGAKLNGFKVEPHEGGTVTLGLRAQFPVDEKLAGRLGVLIGQEVVLAIEPPESDELDDED